MELKNNTFPKTPRWLMVTQQTAETLVVTGFNYQKIKEQRKNQRSDKKANRL